MNNLTFIIALVALTIGTGCAESVPPQGAYDRSPDEPVVLTDCDYVIPSGPEDVIDGQRTQAYVHLTTRVFTPSEINAYGERDVPTQVVDEDAESYSFIYLGRAVCDWSRNWLAPDGSIEHVEGSTWEVIELIP